MSSEGYNILKSACDESSGSHYYFGKRTFHSLSDLHPRILNTGFRTQIQHEGKTYLLAGKAGGRILKRLKVFFGNGYSVLFSNADGCLLEVELLDSGQFHRDGHLWFPIIFYRKE